MKSNVRNTKSEKIIRGSVWLVDCDPVVGHEQGKTRPCVVVSADVHNLNDRGLVFVIPISSVYKELNWLVEVNPPEGGLKKRSYVLCHHLRSISTQRFVSSCWGTLKEETMKQIEFRLQLLLDLPSY